MDESVIVLPLIVLFPRINERRLECLPWFPKKPVSMFACLRESTVAASVRAWICKRTRLSFPTYHHIEDLLTSWKFHVNGNIFRDVTPCSYRRFGITFCLLLQIWRVSQAIIDSKQSSCPLFLSYFFLVLFLNPEDGRSMPLRKVG